MTDDQRPFGDLRPTPAQERVRQCARLLPDVWPARKLSSLLLRAAGGASGAAFDVEVFGSQKARIHPYDNISEKRVYLTPQLWDPKERSLLRQAIRAHPDDDFVFVDVGANAGLYTLFARSVAMACGKRFRALCIEPDPVMLERLRFNLEASGAAEVVVAPFAATAADGPIAFAANAQSRGMNRVVAHGEKTVEGRTLPRLLAEARVDRIDAMKIDVEGHEEAALSPFFADDSAPCPGVLIVEVSHERRERPLKRLINEKGYTQIFDGRLNAVFRRIIARTD
jgi:FkbM family methyltransferase